MARQYLTATEFRAKLLSIPNKNYEDSVLDDILQIATENVELYCERIFSSAYYSDVVRGDGSATFLTHEYPIISVTSMYEDTIDVIPVTTTYDTVNRLLVTTSNLAHGRIALDGLDGDISSFTPGAMYRINYRAGYEVIPPGIRHATALWAAELLRQNYGLTTGGLPEIVSLTSEQIVELLNPHRRRRI